MIGETADIGNNVTIYQCVTLGGTNPANGVGGKRHPTLSDDAIVGSGAQILGPITVGRRARIGANAVVTEDVPEGATMVGVKARSTLVRAETYQKNFMPYGTPCREPCDPENPRIDHLEREVAELKGQLAALLAATGAEDEVVAATPRKTGPELNRVADAPSGTAASPGHATIIPFPARYEPQIGFDRLELARILDLYGRMVAAGEWRDYAMNFGRDAASFSAFRRAAERPQARIEKTPRHARQAGNVDAVRRGGPGAEARARAGRGAVSAGA